MAVAVEVAGGDGLEAGPQSAAVPHGEVVDEVAGAVAGVERHVVVGVDTRDVGAAVAVEVTSRLRADRDEPAPGLDARNLAGQVPAVDATAQGVPDLEGSGRVPGCRMCRARDDRTVDGQIDQSGRRFVACRQPGPHTGVETAGWCRGGVVRGRGDIGGGHGEAPRVVARLGPELEP